VAEKVITVLDVLEIRASSHSADDKIEGYNPSVMPAFNKKGKICLIYSANNGHSGDSSEL